MTTFIYISGGSEQVWACFPWLHLYYNYLEMIKAQFPIGQHFLGFYIIKTKWETSYQETPSPPNVQRQNDITKDKIGSWAFPKRLDKLCQS